MPSSARHQPLDADARRRARSLLRLSDSGAFTYLEISTGDPAVALAGLATDLDGAPLFPFSNLSGRPQALAADPRAALLLTTSSRSDDPLNAPRLQLLGRVRRLEAGQEDFARGRYLQRHPTATDYLDLPDFSLWRLEIESGKFIDGYAKTYPLRPADVLLREDDWSAWQAMEPGAVAHMNEDHGDAIERYATHFCQAEPGVWRMFGLDPEGIDMACGEHRRRLTFDKPLSEAKEAHMALVGLAKAARAADS
ncbi:MAG: DUF2470 domain-containing protein [Pseudomonadota bacterium]